MRGRKYNRGKNFPVYSIKFFTGRHGRLSSLGKHCQPRFCICWQCFLGKTIYYVIPYTMWYLDNISQGKERWPTSSSSTMSRVISFSVTSLLFSRLSIEFFRLFTLFSNTSDLCFACHKKMHKDHHKVWDMSKTSYTGKLCDDVTIRLVN